MGRYKARHLYCSEMSSNKLWDHSLTLTYHLVIWQDTELALGIQAPRGLVAPARLRPPPARGALASSLCRADPDLPA